MKTWHYLFAGYIGYYVWIILAHIGAFLSGASVLPVGSLLILGLLGSVPGLPVGILFKVVEPLVMIPRKMFAAIFWVAIAVAISAMMKQLNFQDVHLYVVLAMAAIAGLCFELVLSALQKKKDSQQPEAA